MWEPVCRQLSVEGRDFSFRTSLRQKGTPSRKSHGILRTNSPVDQEKAVIANQLLANSVIAQTVVDQTRIIQQLKREGYPFSLGDAKHLSPYLTRHLLRFGKFATRRDTEPLPENLGLDP
jgi:hypothetical protein